MIKSMITSEKAIKGLIDEVSSRIIRILSIKYGFDQMEAEANLQLYEQQATAAQATAAQATAAQATAAQATAAQQSHMSSAYKKEKIQTMVCTYKVYMPYKECTRKAAEGLERCKIHEKKYREENPSSLFKLDPITSANALAAMTIIKEFKTHPEKVDNAFREMFASRRIFDPAENANKFATGGIAEEVFTELVQDIGFNAVNVAAVSTVIDVQIHVPIRMSISKDNDTMHLLEVSLKNSGDINCQPILENYRGESKSEIRKLPPTFIIYTETKNQRAKIVYLDNDILQQAHPGLTDDEFNAIIYNKKSKDDTKQSSLGFKSGLLRKIIPRLPDEYILNAKFPDLSFIPFVKKSTTTIALNETRRQLKK